MSKTWNTNRPGHQVMATATMNVSGGAITLYPDPDAGGSAQSSGTKYNASTTAGDSPFAAGDREAVIMAVSVVAEATGRFIVLQTHAGTVISAFRAGSGGNGASYEFGPEGLRVPDGFRVVTDGASTSMSFVVSYDVE
jgi:hypothetical protein